MKLHSIQSTTWMALIVSSLTVGAFMAAAEEVREEFHQTYPLADNGRVTLENVNGSVSIVAWDRNEVKVDAVKRAATQKGLDAVTINVSAKPDRIHIETEYPDSASGWFGWSKSVSVSVDYTLTVPRQVRLDEVSTVNGGLEITGVRGTVKGSSVNGRIKASGLGGETKLSTVNGGIDVSFTQWNPAKSVKLDSVNGGITLMLPPDADAELEAETLNGGISADGELTVKHNFPVGHEVKGQLGKGGGRIKVNTVNGGIQIQRARKSSGE